MEDKEFKQASSKPRPSSTCSEKSAQSFDSEDTMVHNTILSWYESARQPSLYAKKSWGNLRGGGDDSKLDSTLEVVDLESRGDRKHDRNVEGDVVGWDDDRDPKIPLNWPTWKKALNFAVVFMICFVSPFASSAFAPALFDMMLDFQESGLYLSALVVSIYVLGYAIGPLIVGPLSEVYGRVVMYHICNIIFVVFTCLCCVTTSLQTLAVMRFFAGCGGSSAFALGPATVADLVKFKHRGGMYALLGMAYNLGPAISPTVGSYINDAFGWRWVFWLTAIMGGVCTLAGFALSESYEPVLLRRKAKRLQNETGNPKLRSRLDDPLQSTYNRLQRAMLRPVKFLFLCPNVFLVSLLTAVGYGYMYILYTTLPSTFVNNYDWQAKKVGLAYLGAAVGNLVAMMVGGPLSDFIAKRRKAKGDDKPENRLIPMIFHWPLVTVGLIVYGWTAQKQVHWVWPMIGTGIFGIGAMSTILFCGTYVVDAYTVHSASVAAATTVLRSLLGGLVPVFANKMCDVLDVGWTFTVLGLVALVFVPAPYLVYRYGERLRQRFDVVA